MEWLALIVGLIGALSFGALIQSYFDRRTAREEAVKQRSHDSTEARAVRVFERRASAYQAQSIYLERMARFVNLTEPLVGPNLEPEELLPDEAWVQGGATIAITASDDIRVKLRAVVGAFEAFETWVNVLRRERDGLEAPEAGVDPGAEVEKTREKVLALIQEAQTAMRDELDSL